MAPCEANRQATPCNAFHGFIMEAHGWENIDHTQQYAILPWKNLLHGIQMKKLGIRFQIGICDLDYTCFSYIYAYLFNMIFTYNALTILNMLRNILIKLIHLYFGYWIRYSMHTIYHLNINNKENVHIWNQLHTLGHSFYHFTKNKNELTVNTYITNFDKYKTCTLFIWKSSHPCMWKFFCTRHWMLLQLIGHNLIQQPSYYHFEWMFGNMFRRFSNVICVFPFLGR